MLRSAALSIAATVLLFVPGCGGSGPGGGSGGGAAGGAGPQDPFAAAAADAEPDERPFIEPARPFLTALAARNYDAVYDQLSSYAKARMFPAQFTPSVTDGNTLGTPIENVTLEQFKEWLGKAEAELGAPESIRQVYVNETDPKVLSGADDRISVMLAIGSMPAEIPAGIRRASIRAQLICRRSREWAEAIAKAHDGVTAEQVLSGQVKADVKETMDDNPPYMNVKFVLVEEGSQLKVGYFELMPPSMLD
jgi:hypothetical protein